MTNDLEKPKHYLREWRDFRKMTQQELATLVGTGKGVISELESSSMGLSLKWLERLAPALRTTKGAILDYDPTSISADILEVWASVPDANKPQAIEVLETFAKKRAK